jgi:hypothetical protein
MMEALSIQFDDAAFDEIVRNSLPEGGDIAFTVKDRGTVSGKPCVVISWTAQLPDGTHARVQAVTTADLIISAAAALRGRTEQGR